MKRRGLLVAVGLVGAAVGSALFVVFGAMTGAEGARIGACVGVVVVLASLLQRLDVATTDRSPFEASLIPEGVAPMGLPADLEQIERLVRSPMTVGDVHFRLRPVLRDVAQHRLHSVKGLDLDRDVAAARVLLGEDLYALVSVDRSAPVDRLLSSSMSVRDVAGFVKTLETL